MTEAAFSSVNHEESKRLKEFARLPDNLVDHAIFDSQHYDFCHYGLL